MVRAPTLSMLSAIANALEATTVVAISKLTRWSYQLLLE